MLSTIGVSIGTASPASPKRMAVMKKERCVVYRELRTLLGEIRETLFSGSEQTYALQFSWLSSGFSKKPDEGESKLTLQSRGKSAERGAFRSLDRRTNSALSSFVFQK